MKTSTPRIVIALLIVAAVLILLIVPRLTGDREDAVAIGVLLPLTGDARIYGEEMQKGIDLALAEYRLDPQKRKVRVVTEDDAGQARTAVSGFRKLVDVDGVQAVIGGAMSSTAMPTAPIAKEKKVVLISPAAMSSSSILKARRR